METIIGISFIAFVLYRLLSGKEIDDGGKYDGLPWTQKH